MASIYCYVLLVSVLVTLGYCGCRRANWWSSFDRTGLSKCDSSSEYINGFYRNDNNWKNDPLYHLEEAECCSRPSPWTGSKTQVVNADWWATFDHNNRWGYCPAGYFLQGLYRNENNPGWLHNIEEGRCSKPADHPNYHGHCYNHNIGICFDKKGLCTCNSGYFVTGLYRGGCDSLFCMETLRCCKMVSQKETLDEVYKVKTRIMDTTMSDIALLAHYLGYGWCAGCRAPYVGEDFRRNGDTWEADKSGRCSGYKSDHRLSMAYGDWSFEIKDIRYGNPIIQELTPETIDSGTIYNNDPTEATKTISRSETSVRSVTHSTTSSWKHSHELGLEFSYKPPSVTGGAGSSVSYTFKYEQATSTTDSTNNTQANTFTVDSSKTLAPNTATKWHLVLSKTRTTVSYTATILVKFSTELRGFLRWGGGYSDPGTNYHYQHRGSGSRPTVNYRFGDSSVPFYTALKRESDTNSRPWMWNDMKNAHSYAQSLINGLANENRYVFTLTGKFEDVVGKHAEFRWDAVQPTNGRKRSEGGQADESESKILEQVAKAGPDDPPAPNPAPPVVDIKVDSPPPPEPIAVEGN